MTKKTIHGSGTYMATFVEHDRQSLRLPTYDYSQMGAYFVTICAFEREEIFGRIHDGKMVLNESGRIVEIKWFDLPNHHVHIALDEFVIMPNHIHGIIWINGVGARPASPLHKHQHEPIGPSKHKLIRIGGATQASPLPNGPLPHSVGSIVGSFKATVSRHIHTIQKHPRPIWQRNYHDRIIRSEKELFAKRQYIINNPMQWEVDVEYR